MFGVLALLFACALCSSNPWPQFGRNAFHTSDFSSALSWPARGVMVPGNYSEPAHVGLRGAFDSKGNAVWSTYSAMISFSPAGTLQWTFEPKEKIRYSPPWSAHVIGSDGTVYVGCTTQQLYAISSNGTLKWQVGADGWVRTPALVGNDAVVFSTYDDSGQTNSKVIAVSQSTGEQLWSFTDTSNTAFGPVLFMEVDQGEFSKIFLFFFFSLFSRSACGQPSGIVHLQRDHREGATSTGMQRSGWNACSGRSLLWLHARCPN